MKGLCVSCQKGTLGGWFLSLVENPCQPQG